MISQEKIQEIIDKTDIVVLVSEYTTLQKRGKGYFGLCPFHADSNPSFSVSVEKKIAMCMSCGEGGNPITFLRKVKNISLLEAASILAQRASIELDVNIKPKKEDKNKKYYDIYQVAQEFYSYNLFNSKSGKKALEYLYKRGLTEDTIKMFGIGLAPTEKDTLKNVLMDKGFLDIDCIEIGLIKNNGTTLYDVFTNRIMFPITNEQGQTIAFSGRVYDDNNSAKYVNTMETIIYRKGDHLYNLSNAISQINKTKTIVLCEGQMDVIKVYNAGVKDVVCALGSALTTNQVKLIKKYATNVVLAYDNDNAGIKATKTAVTLLSGLNIEVLQLPNGFDPDEFISTHSTEAFNKLFEERINSIEFIYKSYFKDKNIYSLTDVEDIKKGVFSYIKTIKSNTIKEQLFNKLSSDIKINYDSLLKDYNLENGIIEKKSINTNKYNNEPPIYDAPPIYNDYIPDIPPADFGVSNDYNNYSTKPSVGNVVEINAAKNNSNTINKGLEDACVSLISVLIYDEEYLDKMYEYLKGKSIEECFPDPYADLFSHLLYLYNNCSPVGMQDVLRHFKQDGFLGDTFDKVLTKINSFTSRSKFIVILEDSIRHIEEQYLIKQLGKKLTNDINSEIEFMNKKLSKMREIDNIRSTKTKK